MKFRKLRIAWSVTWGIIALLSIALWIRSNWRKEGWSQQSGGARVYVESVMDVVRWGKMQPYFGQDHVWGWDSMEALLNHGELGFPLPAYRGNSLFYEYVLPYWCTTAIALTLCGLPWAYKLRRLPWRFSLRTLLIATTLVAVVLGLIAWVAK